MEKSSGGYNLVSGGGGRGIRGAGGGVAVFGRYGSSSVNSRNFILSEQSQGTLILLIFLVPPDLEGKRYKSVWGVRTPTPPPLADL